MVGLCRRAGFEPAARSESFHSGWELQILGDVEMVALAPVSVALQLPEGVAAVRVVDPPDPLDTALVWRLGDQSPVCAAFREASRAAFADELRAVSTNASTSGRTGGRGQTSETTAGSASATST
jgi:hypothetical protein